MKAKIQPRDTPKYSWTSSRAAAGSKIHPRDCLCLFLEHLPWKAASEHSTTSDRAHLLASCVGGNYPFSQPSSILNCGDHRSCPSRGGLAWLGWMEMKFPRKANKVQFQLAGCARWFPVFGGVRAVLVEGSERTAGLLWVRRAQRMAGQGCRPAVATPFQREPEIAGCLELCGWQRCPGSPCAKALPSIWVLRGFASHLWTHSPHCLWTLHSPLPKLESLVPEA